VELIEINVGREVVAVKLLTLWAMHYVMCVSVVQLGVRHSFMSLEYLFNCLLQIFHCNFLHFCIQTSVMLTIVE